MTESFFVFTDGGARGNPGPGAIGVVVKNHQEKVLAKFGKFIDRVTNNVAEYQAVIEALKWLKEHKKTFDTDATFNFFLDSRLVVNQLNGLFKIKNSHLRDLIIQVRQLEKETDVKILYRLIPREKNKDADFLVNQTLNANGKIASKL